MKTTKFILAGMLLLSLVFQSCEDNRRIISGHGEIVTETLNIREFTSFALQGIDNVHISYGEEQKVEVRGHSNIINRIKRRVINDTWYMELENGRYGRYELTYYLTLPYVESIQSNGTGDIYIEDEMTQNEIQVELTGTGSFHGFLFTSDYCEVDIVGTGSAEVTVHSKLDVNIEGTGKVYYKGHPDIESDIEGTGRIISSN